MNKTHKIKISCKLVASILNHNTEIIIIIIIVIRIRIMMMMMTIALFKKGKQSTVGRVKELSTLA